MKRAALIVVLVLLIAAGVIGWLLVRQQSISVATVLPADTMMLARIPDGWATAKKYEKSKLKEVVESDELGFIVSYLLTATAQDAGIDIFKNLEKAEELTDLFWQNLSGECFIAIFDLDLKELEKNGLVAGLRPYPGTNNLENFISRVKAEMADELGGQATGTSEYGGVAYEWVELSEGFRLCQGAVGQWSITAIGEGAFHRFIDSVNDPKGAKLVDNAEYKGVAAELKKPMDAQFFFNFLPLKEKLLDQMESDPALADDVPMLREAYGPVTAFGAGMRFTDSRDVEDVWISLMPLKDRPDLGATFEPCAYRTLRYTNSSTVVYFAQNIDWKRYWDYLVKLYSNSPDLIQGLTMVESSFKAFGLDLQTNVLDALGPEIGLQMDWPDSAPAPDAALYLEVVDWTAFTPVVKALMAYSKEQTADQLGASAPLGEWSSEIIDGGVELQTFTIPGNAFSPTLISKGPLFGLFMTRDSAVRILAGSEEDTILTQPAFTSLNIDTKDTSSLTYVQMSTLVARSYETLKSLAQMAALFAPDLAQQFDPDSLPDALEVARPLGAWAMIAYVTPEAGLAQSVSAIGNPIVPSALMMGIAAPLLEDMAAAFTPQETVVVMPDDDDPQSAGAVRAELSELRSVIDAWASAQNAPAGTAVLWEQLEGYFIPGSRLEESGGSDALGNPYVLGIVGEQPADVGPETKNSFPDQDDSFWAPQVSPAPELIIPETDGPGEEETAPQAS